VRGNLTYAWDLEASSNVNSVPLDDAIRGPEALLAFEPKYSNGRAYYLRALAYHRKGDLSEVVRDCQAACGEGCASCCETVR